MTKRARRNDAMAQARRWAKFHSMNSDLRFSKVLYYVQRAHSILPVSDRQWNNLIPEMGGNTVERLMQCVRMR